MRTPAEKHGLVFDIDDTTVPDGALTVASARLRRAFGSMSRDIYRIPASARPIETTLPIVRALGVEGLAIVAGGARVIDVETGEADVAWERVLTPDQVAQVVENCHEANYSMRIVGMGRDAKPQLARDQHIVQATTVYALQLPVVAAYELRDNLVKSGLRASATPSDRHIPDTYDLTVSHPEAQKHTALRYVCGKYGIVASQLSAIGDGLNDMCLVDEVGYFYAMGNAHPDLRRRADETVATCQEDGLAQVIERDFID